MKSPSREIKIDYSNLTSDAEGRRIEWMLSQMSDEQIGRFKRKHPEIKFLQDDGTPIDSGV